MDDYIRRADVIAELNAEGYTKNTRFHKRFLTIPAANVRPVKRGEWIPVTHGRGGHECDQCHDYAPSVQTGAERLTNFCPNCGADMTGGEHDG